MNETNIVRLILMAISKLPGVVGFRQNTGLGWVGDVVRLPEGDMLLRNARPLHAGLIEGSSDIIGWTSITITSEWVGRRVGIFTAIEVKTKRGRATDQQTHFLEMVKSAGGISGIARSAEEATRIIQETISGIY